MKLLSTGSFRLHLDLKELPATGEFAVTQHSSSSSPPDDDQVGGAFRVDYDGSGHWSQKFIGRLEGTLEMLDKKDGSTSQFGGNVMLSHMVQSVKPWVTSGRVSFMNFHSRTASSAISRDSAISSTGDVTLAAPAGTMSVLIQQVISPKKLNGQVVNFAMVFENGRMLGVTDKVRVTELGQPVIDPETRLAIPEKYTMQIEGVTTASTTETASATAFQLTIERDLARGGTLIDRLNVLDTLPGIIRGIVKAVIKNPMVYRYLDEGNVTVQVQGRNSVTYQGMGFVELAFIEY